tara:strand:- start:830 stop:1381 length:552 start_codon:yes stop_codon:yes gene_type:complete
MKIPSNMLRAAMICQGNKDVRFYLNGVHIKNKYVEATNGHVAVRMTMEKSCRKDVIISIKSKIPAIAVSTVFVLKGEMIAKHYDAFEQLISVSVIELVDGRYPNIDNAIKKEIKPTDVIGVNPSYIALWPKMFKEKWSSAKMTFNGADGAIKITSTSEFINHNYGSPIFVIMPTRLARTNYDN